MKRHPLLCLAVSAPLRLRVFPFTLRLALWSAFIQLCWYGSESGATVCPARANRGRGTGWPNGPTVAPSQFSDRRSSTNENGVHAASGHVTPLVRGLSTRRWSGSFVPRWRFGIAAGSVKRWWV